MNDVKKLVDHLSLSQSADDYQNRVRGLVRDIAGSFEYTVLLINQNAETIAHFQSTPMEMYRDSIKINVSNLVPINAIRTRGETTFVSELVEYTKKDTFTRNLCSDFLDIVNIMKKFGYHDYMNSSIIVDNSKTLVFSIAEHDASPWNLKKHVRNNERKIANLGIAISNTIGLSVDKIRGKITERQAQVLQALSTGNGTIEQAAQTLNIAPSSISNHLAAIKKSTGIDKTTIMIAQALREKVIL